MADGSHEPEDGAWEDPEPDAVLNARMQLDFLEWWQPAVPDRPWVRLVTLRTGAPFLAWWQLGNRVPLRGGAPPVIEVAGRAPPDGVRIDLLDEVDAVGWWILSRVDIDSARRWIDVGVSDPFLTRQWGYALGQFVPAALGFDRERLARSELGWWHLTDEGYRVVAELTALEVDPLRLEDSSVHILGYLSRQAPGVINRLVA